MRYLISGGGTGGHIFPAISIANALRELDPTSEILFVGALGRMEMERVPQAGYKIVGLPVRGFDRKHIWKNVRVLADLVRSMLQARKIVRTFRPDVGVGVGGYASGAAMKVAARMGVPILLQEQNGFAGVTNKLLRKDARKICVAYEGMERFFPKDKIILTGNPVRQDLTTGTREAAVGYFSDEFGVRLDPHKKTLLILGGSLGAKTINEAITVGLPTLVAADIQVIWQTGKVYYDSVCKAVGTLPEEGMVVTPFLGKMALAYAMADLVISRAGASSISELCLLGKPSLLVPSPNVAEDHQTHNAMALVQRQAAVLVRDAEAKEALVSTALDLIRDEAHLKALHTNILRLALPDSAHRIAEEVISLAQERHTVEDRREV